MMSVIEPLLGSPGGWDIGRKSEVRLRNQDHLGPFDHRSD